MSKIYKFWSIIFITVCFHYPFFPAVQTLDFARSELRARRLKPSTTVKNTLATLNERFRHCLSMSKMLNAENLLAESGIDPSDTTLTADRMLYSHAIEQCQSAALDELFDNPGECVQR